jgi:hypothetical protein
MSSNLLYTFVVGVATISAVTGAPVAPRSLNKNTMGILGDAGVHTGANTSSGMPITWQYAPTSESCSTTCTRIGMPCLTGQTWPILSSADFTRFSGIVCSTYQAGNIVMNPVIEFPSQACFWDGASDCSAIPAATSRRLCPCNTPPPPPPQLFRCVTNQCIPDPGGVPLETCLQLCGFDNTNITTKAEESTRSGPTRAQTRAMQNSKLKHEEGAVANVTIDANTKARTCSWPATSWNQSPNTYRTYQCVMSPGFPATLVRHCKFKSHHLFLSDRYAT